MIFIIIDHKNDACDLKSPNVLVYNVTFARVGLFAVSAPLLTEMMLSVTDNLSCLI